jgi:NADH-quinone oxidoreductase subunit L
MPDVVVALIPGLPLLAAVANGVNALLGGRYPHAVVHRLASGSILLALFGSVWVFVSVLVDPDSRQVTVYRWLASDDLEADFAFLIDSLSAVMMLVVTSISFLISVFSVNYLRNEGGVSRFFTVTPLFVFAMLVLVMADNYALLFLGWEGVGICSYLLIGFYYDRASAARAGTKAFIMNRFGDAGFLLAIFLIVDSFGSATFTEVFSGADQAGAGTVTAVGLLLLVGAVGKSAQLPLGTWLSRAMEGPTPSSALIHAATMVTAGVYLIARSHPIYNEAPDALLVVGIVGAATAVFGALVGLVQTDIKSILAYSTTSQLGLMFLACGLGAYAVAIFHLAAHAVFKTYLFLTAPSILHHMHASPDVRQTGPSAPRRYVLALGGAAGLLAFPFASGWWQGDFGDRAAASGLYILLALAGLAVFSAVASTRQLVGQTSGRGAHPGSAGRGSASSSAWIVVAALAALAVTVALGLLFQILPGGLEGSWFGEFLAPVISAEPGLPGGHPLLGLVFLIALMALLLVGWFTPLYLGRLRPELPGVYSLTKRGAYNFALNRFWLDELYGAAVVRPARRLGALLYRFDTGVIDRATGTPLSPSAVRTDIERHREEQLLASHGAELTGRAAPLTSPWRDDRDERATLTGEGEGAGLLGWLGTMHRRAPTWMRVGVRRRTTGGLAGWLTDAIAAVSHAAERVLFDRLPHVWLPRASNLAARGLESIESGFAHPAGWGSLLAIALSAILIGGL